MNMHTFSAKIIEDSISAEGKRLTTMQLTYPRFIHAEFMTHRVFSRNASSSRAIPVAKMIEQVRTNPAMPVHWGKNQPGMQAHEAFTGKDAAACEKAWRVAASNAAGVAEAMNTFGLHKQVANRILEPFQWIHVIVTATEWENFFQLRVHPDAQPEIRVLAELMLMAMSTSTPKLLKEGEWHLPYITQDERNDSYFIAHPEKLCAISAARCARVSYLLHDGSVPDLKKDLALYDRLVGSVPLHASPVEHQATPDKFVEQYSGNTDDQPDMAEYWDQPAMHGNFVGWQQFRKTVELQFNQAVTID